MKTNYETQLKKVNEELEEAKESGGGGVQVDNSKMDKMMQQFNAMQEHFQRMSIVQNQTPFASDQTNESPKQAAEQQKLQARCDELEQ